MKRLALVLCLPLLSASAGPIGLLPEERVAVEVSPTEKNPFGPKVAKDGNNKLPRNADNEEARLRLIFEHLPVGGIVESNSGRKVMLGSLMLEEGRPIPPLLSNQDEKLKVIAIEAKRVEISFVEVDGTTGARKIIVPLDVAPRVQYRLGVKVAPGKKGGFDGVITKDEFVSPQ
jgi:hypothetical protein